jgi:uncharacterized protein YbjT (DUF2867 family)
MKTAIIIGSTGMIGTQLLDLLLQSDDYSQVISLIRRGSGITHPKLKEYVVDFDEPENWKKHVKGDVLFSCMGTTLASAKSKENQFKVDYTYQFQVAKVAAKNDVAEYVLISSAGANEKSSNFYLQMKGKLDNDVKKLSVKKTYILRPGQLYGVRYASRLGEKIGLKVMFTINRIGLFRKFKPIHSRELAQAMINVTKKNQSSTYTLNEVFTLL